MIITKFSSFSPQICNLRICTCVPTRRPRLDSTSFHLWPCPLTFRCQSQCIIYLPALLIMTGDVFLL